MRATPQPVEWLTDSPVVAMSQTHAFDIIGYMQVRESVCAV